MMEQEELKMPETKTEQSVQQGCHPDLRFTNFLCHSVDRARLVS